jgi:hypothetical protein
MAQAAPEGGKESLKFTDTTVAGETIPSCARQSLNVQGSPYIFGGQTSVWPIQINNMTLNRETIIESAATLGSTCR